MICFPNPNKKCPECKGNHHYLCKTCPRCGEPVQALYTETKEDISKTK
jgi:predicted amidophosphoribosyltransferase